MTCDPWGEPLDLPARLRVSRARWNLSIEDAAARCGLVKSTWATWEQGVKPRDAMQTLHVIARELKVDLQWLAFGTSEADTLPISDMCPYLQLSMALDDESSQRNGAESWTTQPSSTLTGRLNELEDSPRQPSAPTGPSTPVSAPGLVDAA